MLAISTLEQEIEIISPGRFSGLFLGIALAAFIIFARIFYGVHFSYHAPFDLFGLVNVKNIIIHPVILMMEYLDTGRNLLR